MAEMILSKSREHLLLDAVNLVVMGSISVQAAGTPSSFPSPASNVPAKVSDVDLQIQKLEAWLEQSSGSLSSAIRTPAYRALAVLKGLSIRFANLGRELPRPLAAPGESSGFMLSWDLNEHHLEVEFDERSVASWFYWNRATDASWENDIADPPGFDKGVLARLELLRSVAS